MKSQLPPGLPLPPFAQMAWFVFRPISYLETCRRLFGNSFTVRLPGYPPWITLTDPEDIRAVFTGKPEDLFAGPANAVLKPVLRENSLLLLDAPRHIAERKMMNPAFHGERMMAYGETMVQCTDRAIAGWPRKRRFELHPKLQELTLNVILRTVFGLDDLERYGRLRDLIVRFLEQSSNPALFLFIRANGELLVSDRIARLRVTPFGHLFRMIDEMDALLIAEFARRRAEGFEHRDDILSQFLGMRDEAGQPLSDAWIRDEMMTLLLAGHETTATALAWFFYHVAGNPDVRDKLRAELETAGGPGATPQEIMKLPYLDAAIKESMRLSPVISWVGRRLEKPTRIGKWDLPKGAMVLPSIYLTHRRPDLWPEPERFNPDRFLAGAPAPTSFFPFGGGARRCIGMAFANYEMKIVAARVLQQLSIELPKGYEGTATRRGITLSPALRLPVEISDNLIK